MLRLKVLRQTFTPLSTQGSLLIQGLPFCHTLEPRKDKSQGKPYCVNPGTFKVLLLLSPHFKCVTPHVMNVPNFTEVEVHWGDYPRDTEACCLVGYTKAADFVGNSRAAFDALMKQLGHVLPDGSMECNDPEGIEITYEETGI